MELEFRKWITEVMSQGGVEPEKEPIPVTAVPTFTAKYDIDAPVNLANYAKFNHRHIHRRRRK